MAAKKIPADARGLHGLMKRFKEQGAEPVYLLVGEDRKDIESALEFISEQLVDPDLASLNSASVRGTDITGDEVVAACSTFPMMADRRLIILREPEKLGAGQDAFTGYLESPADSATLVLVPNELDRRRKFSQALLAGSCTVVFEPPSPRDLDAWVARALGTRGIEVEPDAMALLADLVEADTLLLSNELEKLALYCADTKVVRRDDVAVLLGRTRTIDVWELTNAIEDGRPGDAVLALRRLLEQGAAIPMLVGTLDWCLGRLLASEAPKAPPGRRRALERRRAALQGRAGRVYGLLRQTDQLLRTTGGSPAGALELAVLEAASDG